MANKPKMFNISKILNEKQVGTDQKVLAKTSVIKRSQIVIIIKILLPELHHENNTADSNRGRAF